MMEPVRNSVSDLMQHWGVEMSTYDRRQIRDWAKHHGATDPPVWAALAESAKYLADLAKRGHIVAPQDEVERHIDVILAVAESLITDLPAASE